MKKTLLMLSMLLSLPACDQSADEITQKKTEKLMQEATRQVDIPAIKNFTEKRTLKQIYELRDKNVVTYTYIVDMNGKRHFLCTSQGYGIPYTAQYTNPLKPEWHSGVILTMPQPEPNGLFMPESSSATWVLCLNEQSKQATPVYVEPLIIVSPFKM